MTPTSGNDPLNQLLGGPLFQFADWPVEEVPQAAAGVYSIWDQDRLLYIGMSGRGADEARIEQARTVGRPLGLVTRLASHASGRRSGDQFCVYVADFLVLPDLTADDIEKVASREIALDDRVKRYIRDRMSFRFIQTQSGADAFRLEAEARAGALGQLPYLNPSN